MQLVCKLAEEHKVPSEDWESLVWHNGKLFSGSTSNGNVKVWKLVNIKKTIKNGVKN